MLVLTIKVADRDIKVTFREGSDLNKIYERIHLLGSFDEFPKKFKKIFIRFWETNIEEARAILKKK